MFRTYKRKVELGMKMFLITIMLGAWVSIGAVGQDPNHDLKVRKAQEVVIKAQRDWPNDYSMQLWQINKEINALEQMDKICEKMNIK